MICDKCNFKTKCHEILVSHVAKKHKQCLKCSLTFMLQDDLLTHLEFVHGENVKCPNCEFKAYPSFELAYHQMIEHGVCGKCTDGKDENHHLKVQHQSRIQELTTVQSQRRKPGPKSRQIAMNSLNSAGESNSDESMDQMEIMEKIIESDENDCETFSANPRFMSNQLFPCDPKVKAKILILFIKLEILIFPRNLITT